MTSLNCLAGMRGVARVRPHTSRRASASDEPGYMITGASWAITLIVWIESTGLAELRPSPRPHATKFNFKRVFFDCCNVTSAYLIAVFASHARLGTHRWAV